MGKWTIEWYLAYRGTASWIIDTPKELLIRIWSSHDRFVKLKRYSELWQPYTLHKDKHLNTRNNITLATKIS